mmetsp:Transcript_21506/g.39199  ORF Transcript_21506/g.39199 Transcript_21506/m.39199 type:complete len:163 (+) Transcript_21506:78-566(+)
MVGDRQFASMAIWRTAMAFAVLVHYLLKFGACHRLNNKLRQSSQAQSAVSIRPGCTCGIAPSEYLERMKSLYPPESVTAWAVALTYKNNVHMCSCHDELDLADEIYESLMGCRCEHTDEEFYEEYVQACQDFLPDYEPSELEASNAKLIMRKQCNCDEGPPS